MPLDTTSQTLSNITPRTSFWSLDESSRKKILAYDRNKTELNAAILVEKREEDTSITQQRIRISSLVTYYTKELESTNPAIFPFLTENVKYALKVEFRYAGFLLKAQAKIDLAEGRIHSFKKQIAALALCQDLEDRLNKKKLGKERNDKAVSFNNYYDNKTGYIKEIMSTFNGKRLYWVWAGSMLAAILQMLPLDFFNNLQAQEALALPAPYTGAISFLLYYARFAMRFGLLLKHTINHPWWMSKEEAEIGAKARFKADWDQCKFDLLNDFVWASANCVCYFWLRGPGMAGYLGGVLTVILLIMDLTVAISKYREAKKQYEVEIRELKLNGTGQDVKVTDLGYLLKMRAYYGGSATFAGKKIECCLELAEEDLKQMKAYKELEWKFKRYGLLNDIGYSAGLIVAFSVLACVFFPPTVIVAPVTILMVSLIGAVSCFTLNVAYAVIGAIIELAKVKAFSGENKILMTSAENRWRHTANYDDETRVLYLKMKGFDNDSVYYEESIRFQRNNLVSAVLNAVLFPAVVFASLVFLPLGIAACTLALTAALMLLVSKSKLLNKAPEKADHAEFKEAEFLAKVTQTRTSSFFRDVVAKRELGNGVRIGVRTLVKSGSGDYNLSPAIYA